MSRASALLVGSALVLFAGGPVWRAVAANDDDKESLAALESEETSRMIRAELPKWKLWSGADAAMQVARQPSVAKSAALKARGLSADARHAI